MSFAIMALSGVAIGLATAAGGIYTNSGWFWVIQFAAGGYYVAGLID